MSEFDRRSSLRKPEFIPPRDEDFDDSVFDQAAAEASPTEGREGLPPTFRMRHDEHYVDQITSRMVAPPVQFVAVKDIDGAERLSRLELGPLVESIMSIGVVQPLLVRRRNGRYELIAGSKRLAAAIAAGLAEVPCLLQEADDERARDLAAADNLRFQAEEARPAGAPRAGLPVAATRGIIDSLATIESCLNLFLDRERPLRERVSASLIRAEAHRARWLAEAYSLLSGTPTVVKRPLSPVSLVERALADLEMEGRLSDVKVALSIDEPTRTLVADERLMWVALTGAAGAMLTLLEGRSGATLRVRVSTQSATRQLAFQLAQDVAAAPPARLYALDEASLPDWSADQRAPAGLAVARRIARLHGGRLDVAPGPRGCGCTVTLMLPAGD